MPYKILDKVPEGWIETKGATHHPKGAKWYNNGKPRFSGEYEFALVIINQEEYNKNHERI